MSKWAVDLFKHFILFGKCFFQIVDNVIQPFFLFILKTPLDSTVTVDLMMLYEKNAYRIFEEDSYEDHRIKKEIGRAHV